MEKILSAAKSKTVDNLIDKGTGAIVLALWYLCGFTLSGAGLFSVRVPLCVGLAAACTGTELVAVCAGSITGCLCCRVRRQHNRMFFENGNERIADLPCSSCRRGSACVSLRKTASAL